MIGPDDSIILVDIEATCWKHRPPEGQQSEIIEIGLCVLDLASSELRQPRSLVVRPQRSKVSAFCTRLTSITQTMVDDGLWFPEACAIIAAEYAGAGHIWASWSDYDLKMLTRQCESLDVPYPFGPRHVDLKALFARAQGLNSQIGLVRAIKSSGLTWEGRHHRGVDDAWNLGLLLQHLLQTHGATALWQHLEPA